MYKQQISNKSNSLVLSNRIGTNFRFIKLICIILLKQAIFEIQGYNYILFSSKCASSLAFRALGRFYVFERYDRASNARIKYLSRRRNLQKVTPLRYEFVESRRSAMEHKGCRSNEVLELARGSFVGAM